MAPEGAPSVLCVVLDEVGLAQMARFRQPGVAAMAFMNTLAPTEARFSARARSARRPVQGERDAEAGEDQGGGVGDRGLEGGDSGQVAGGVDSAGFGGSYTLTGAVTAEAPGWNDLDYGDRGQIKIKGPKSFAGVMPGRFTSDVRGREKHLNPGFDAAPARVAGALTASSVDCYRAGLNGPIRLGPQGSPRRHPTALVGGPVSASWAKRRRK